MRTRSLGVPGFASHTLLRCFRLSVPRILLSNLFNLVPVNNVLFFLKIKSLVLFWSGLMSFPSLAGNRYSDTGTGEPRQFPDAGQMLADAWGDQTTWIGFSLVGVRDDGKFAAECAMAIRSESSLWFVDLGGKGPVPVAVTTATFTQMRGFLDTLFSPTGITQVPVTAAVPGSGFREVPVPQTPPPSQPVMFQPQGTAQPPGSFCPACGSPVAPDKKFCGTCGVTLATQQQAGQPQQNTCPKCSQANKPGARFCFDCGARLS
jgi:predicted nucleic acid-binding Zn ribbon protein